MFTKIDSSGNIKRLSVGRLSIALALLVSIVYLMFVSQKQWQATQAAQAIEPWFASYVDVTATPTFAFEQMGTTTSTRNAVLSFIVASPKDPCTPSWGDSYTLDDAGAHLDLDRRIARLQQQGGSIAVSFGGLLNDELAVVCEDKAKLTSAYEKVINRYDVDTIDLDLEGSGLTDTEVGKRRAESLAELQTKRRESGKNLAIWVTLPVTAQGLNEDGTNAISILLENGVDISGVNIMTMNFGESKNDMKMYDAAVSSLNETKRQVKILYQRVGIELSDATLWKKLGATPMIGQNDIADEVFETSDAKKLNSFGKSQGLGRMSMWSANRDRKCGGNYTDTNIVSDSCSGASQDKEEFATELSKGFEAQLKNNSSYITVDESDKKEIKEDDPSTSPYQIWKENGRYLQGTKVVWRQNVYEAKWWTQGDLPDNPVLQSFETPWKLIGPVLPGEIPIVQPTVPVGSYPEWTGTEIYQSGQRVLFEKIPYEAKWWTQGDSPAAASSNADGSPWVPLTQNQIESILDKLKNN